jgi:hypothetical protein
MINDHQLVRDTAHRMHSITICHYASSAAELWTRAKDVGRGVVWIFEAVEYARERPEAGHAVERTLDHFDVLHDARCAKAPFEELTVTHECDHSFLSTGDPFAQLLNALIQQRWCKILAHRPFIHLLPLHQWWAATLEDGVRSCDCTLQRRMSDQCDALISDQRGKALPRSTQLLLAFFGHRSVVAKAHE